MLTELMGAHKVVGVKQSRKAIREGVADTAYVAKNADDRIIESFMELCFETGVAVVEVPTMDELGGACGISVGAAVAVSLKAV